MGVIAYGKKIPADTQLIFGSHFLVRPLKFMEGIQKICHHDISALSAQSEIKLWTAVGFLTVDATIPAFLAALVLSFKEGRRDAECA